jgi:hypothetical protein
LSRKSQMLNTNNCTPHTEFHQNRMINVESAERKAVPSVREEDCAHSHETHSHSIHYCGYLLYQFYSYRIISYLSLHKFSQNP